MDNIRRMAELEAERDAALEQVIYWRERAVGAEREREELAAHARRAVTEWEADDQFEDDWIDRMDHLLKCEAPAVSLARMRDERAQAIQQAVARARREWAREDAAAIARRDALKQAEALERYSRIITEEWIDKGENYGLRTASGQALLQAAELRRQAEEPAE